jgi:hypothetical protein
VAAVSSSREIADRAVALATGNDGESDRDKARATLIEMAGDKSGPLEEARKLLVGRIRMRSDDFPATGGLSLLNATLTKLGWTDSVEWQPRVWRIPH